MSNAFYRYRLEDKTGEIGDRFYADATVAKVAAMNRTERGSPTRVIEYECLCEEISVVWDPDPEVLGRLPS